MKRSIVVLGTIAALLSGLGTAGGTIWYVHPDSTLSSIQAGLDSCSTGDTVLVGAGIYFENIDWPNTHGIDLLGEYGDDMTVIDGGGTGRVMLIGTGVDSTTLINGFTIQNGYSDYGAGIYCIGGSSPTISNSTITNNTATVRGGGIRCFNNSSPIITDNTITLNHADEWGGGVSCNSSAPFISGNTITENTASSNAGIASGYESAPTITGNIITDNSAIEVAGGIGCGYDYVVSATINGNTIRNNTANDFAGGIFCVESSPIIQSCCIDSNIGGGVYCYLGAEPIINYNDIVGNIGYGVYNDEPTVMINAENNWWGDPSGPSGVGPGTGDSVSTYVDYDPWLTEPVVGIEEIVSQVSPIQSILLQNRPNPFDLQTTIRCGLPKESRVTLKVYNVLGQEIRVLVDEFQQAGTHSVVWDSRDNAGRRVSCGTYFLRLEAEEYSAARKLCVVR